MRQLVHREVEDLPQADRLRVRRELNWGGAAEKTDANAHCTVYHRRVKRADYHADRRRQALLRFMDTFGLKALPWSRAGGISPSAIYNFLNGRAESLSQPTLEALARAVGRPVSEITGETVAELTPTEVRQVLVQGSVGAGNFRDSGEWPLDGQFTIRVPITVPGTNFFGLAVDGADMNQVYPDGSVLVCAPIKKRRRLKSGDRVIVERRASNGQIERTVREIQFDDEGRTWLWPKSDRPQHQQPAEIYWPPDFEPDERDRETREVMIIAVVVGSYQPEKHRTNPGLVARR